MPMEMIDGGPWNDWHNAAQYQSYIDEFPIYGWLNETLASVARLGDADRVLDLACGTGATALACVARMPRDAELVGVDVALPMVEIARAEVDDPRCRFFVSDARGLSRHVRGDFDRVVCNAAFWQLPDTSAVLDQLAQVSRLGAELAFSIPTQQLAPEQVKAHPFQLALARKIRELEPDAGPGGARFTSEAGLRTLLAERGFRVERLEIATYHGRQQELVDLMHLPAMTATVAPGVPTDLCRRAVAEAAEWVDPEEPVSVPWTFVVAEYRPD